MKEKKESPRFKTVNSIILFLHLVFPMWMPAIIYTYGISSNLFLIALSASLLLGVVYKIVNRLQNGKAVLYIARAVTFLCIAAFYVPMILLINFRHTEALYRLKRADYAYGVFGEYADFYLQLLPEKLPDECDDYYFHTRGNVPAQDYHPSSYLMFHTDADTIDRYAGYYEGMDCEIRTNEGDSEKFQSDIEWFCGQMRLREMFNDDLDNAVLYWFDKLYPKAVLLNRETGLVAILT